MDRIDDFEAFLAIVERGSLSAAARHLQRSLQSVSRSLASLESSVGVALVHRTTRRSRPTEAGRAFYLRVKPALAELHGAREEAIDRARSLAGPLRVAAPAQFARAFVVPALCDLLARHPQVEVELKACDQQVALLEEGLDVAIRIRRLPDSTLKARRLGALRIVAFGARSYLDRRGRPSHPDDLARHECIVRTVDGSDEAWMFRIDGEVRKVRVQGRFHADDATAVNAAVARGLGLGFGPLWQIREWLDNGAVELVLQAFEAGTMPVYAVLPPTNTQPAKVRAFVDLLAARLKEAMP